MTNEELRRHNEGRKIYQIAWVTRDLDKSLKAWVEHLKVGPWRVYSFTDRSVKNLHVGGKPVTEPFEFRIAISWIGDMEVEIIEPVMGRRSIRNSSTRRARGCTTSRRRSPTTTWRPWSPTTPAAGSR